MAAIPVRPQYLSIGTVYKFAHRGAGDILAKLSNLNKETLIAEFKIMGRSQRINIGEDEIEDMDTLDDLVALDGRVIQWIRPLSLNPPPTTFFNATPEDLRVLLGREIERLDRLNTKLSMFDITTEEDRIKKATLITKQEAAKTDVESYGVSLTQPIGLLVQGKYYKVMGGFGTQISLFYGKSFYHPLTLQDVFPPRYPRVSYISTYGDFANLLIYEVTSYDVSKEQLRFNLANLLQSVESMKARKMKARNNSESGGIQEKIVILESAITGIEELLVRFESEGHAGGRRRRSTKKQKRHRRKHSKSRRHPKKLMRH